MSNPIAGVSAPSSDNKRGTLRRRVAKSAKIAFGDFRFVHDCSLRDMTPDGAKIRVVATREIPDEFHVVFTTERMIRPAQVIWRRGDDLGVKFLGAATSL